MDQCIGCTNCIRSCPMEAMRVLNGKVSIMADRCVDCGECVRNCKSYAIDCERGSIEDIKNYDYTIVIPTASLYAQFNNLNDTNIVLTALKELGFDMVFECTGAQEIVSELTREYIKANKDKWPIISSSCPAVLRIILNRFPGLIDNLLPIRPPVEAAAILAVDKAMKETGLSRDKIGVFFIAPCPSKIASFVVPVGSMSANIDVSIAIKDIYPLLLEKMKQVHENPESLSISGRVGNGWSVSGGEAAGTFDENAIAASGLKNVFSVLEAIEDEKNKKELKFIELRACPNGCIGGPFNLENPFIAASKIKSIAKYLPVTQSHVCDFHEEQIEKLYSDGSFEYDPVYNLGSDFVESMQNLKRIEMLMEKLPHYDCGSCGCPSCKALAEDIIRGKRVLNNCVYYKKNIEIGSTI